MKCNHLFFAGFLVLLLGIACEDTDPPITQPIPSNEFVFILNEGNFQSGNASLDVYDIREEQLQSHAFDSVNLRPLGDVLQSMTVAAGFGYLVVNNSSKIEVIDMATWASEGTIGGFTSPRFMLPITGIKAYVTDLFANHIAILDLRTGNVNDTIAFPGWGEEMLLHQGEVFVTNVNRPYLYVINPSIDRVVDSLAVGIGGNSLRLDAEGMIWVLCGGDFQGTPPSIYRIDPLNLTVLNSIPLQGTNASDLEISADGRTLYYLNSGVYRMPISSTEAPSLPFVNQGENVNFYGLGVDPLTDIIYISDARDFASRGRILRYNPDGSQINTFDGGIIPGDFHFVR